MIATAASGAAELSTAFDSVATRVSGAAGQTVKSALSIRGAISSTVAGVGQMARQVTTAAAQIGKALVAMPGQLVAATSAAIRRVGTSIAKLGTVGAGISAAIVTPAILAAKSWAAYGDRIRGVQNDLLRFRLTAEEASIIARVSDQTGESMERLAQDIRDGSRDFSRWKNELQQSGTLMSGAGLAAALALSRAYYGLKSSVAGLKNAVGAALGPTLTASTKLISGMVRGITQWINRNPALVAQAFRIASAVGLAATGVTILGGAIAGVGTALSPFTAALAAIAAGLTIVEIRTGTGQTIWATYAASVQRVYKTVTQHLGQMLAFTSKVIGAVKDAVIAGDLSAAVDVMWAGAKVVWFTALREIDKMTGGMFSGLLESLAAGKWALAAQSIMNALQIAWLEGVNALARIFNDAIESIKTRFSGLLGWVQPLWDAFTVGATIMIDAFLDGISTIKEAFASLLGFVAKNVLSPLVAEMEKLPSTLAMNTRSILMDVQSGVEGAALALKKSLRAEQEAGGDAKDRRKRRQAEEPPKTPGILTDESRVAREKEITQLKTQQDALAKKTGLQAAQNRNQIQKDLDAAIQAAQLARATAAAGGLQEKDFAVSQETQSISRFSGEGLGMSVGRSADPAERVAKLTEDQNKELRELRKEMNEYNREMRRLQHMGGFS